MVTTINTPPAPEEAEGDQKKELFKKVEGVVVPGDDATGNQTQSPSILAAALESMNIATNDADVDRKGQRTRRTDGQFNTLAREGEEEEDETSDHHDLEISVPPFVHGINGKDDNEDDRENDQSENDTIPLPLPSPQLSMGYSTGPHRGRHLHHSYHHHHHHHHPRPHHRRNYRSQPQYDDHGPQHDYHHPYNPHLHPSRREGGTPGMRGGRGRGGGGLSHHFGHLGFHPEHTGGQFTRNHNFRERGFGSGFGTPLHHSYPKPRPLPSLPLHPPLNTHDEGKGMFEHPLPPPPPPPFPPYPHQPPFVGFPLPGHPNHQGPPCAPPPPPPGLNGYTSYEEGLPQDQQHDCGHGHQHGPEHGLHPRHRAPGYDHESFQSQSDSDSDPEAGSKSESGSEFECQFEHQHNRKKASPSEYGEVAGLTLDRARFAESDGALPLEAQYGFGPHFSRGRHGGQEYRPQRQPQTPSHGHRHGRLQPLQEHDRRGGGHFMHRQGGQTHGSRQGHDHGHPNEGPHSTSTY